MPANEADAKRQQRPCRPDRRSSLSHVAGRGRPSRTISRRAARRAIPTATAPGRRRRCGSRRCPCMKIARGRARQVRRGLDPSASTVRSKRASFARFSVASIRSSPPLRGRRRSTPAGCASRPDRMAVSQVPRRGSGRIARRRNIYRTLRMAIACSKQYSAVRPATR